MPALDGSNIMTLEKKPTMPLSFQRSAKEYLCSTLYYFNTLSILGEQKKKQPEEQQYL